MNTHDPIGLMFGGMEKLAPGANEQTLHVLRLLPRQTLRVVVDAGCGTGRQTLVLAKQLGTLIHAVDSYAPFLSELARRASEAKIGELVRTHCLDMKDIPRVFHDVELVWSEGAAYNIGFPKALTDWAGVVVPGGFVVASELVWLKQNAPTATREFFRTGYPDMQSRQHNIAVAENAGYRVLATHTLPREAWVDGYYDVLGPRAKALAEHADAGVRRLAAEILREIEVFESSDDSYGYVFYVLERA
jgi:SAM-dependent methyltransferase